MALHSQVTGLVVADGNHGGPPIDVQQASTLYALGGELMGSNTGTRAANLRQAIACYEAALRVRTEARLPAGLGDDPEQPGLAYANLPGGDRAANLRQAIACYEAALRIRTEGDFPQDWA